MAASGSVGRYFGTDGIRGRAGAPPLDPPTVRRIGRAIVRALGTVRPRVLLGRDTRESGPWIEAHLTAGLQAEGAQVETTGVIPTPAIAHLVRARPEYDLGVVLSASHNPYQDNGIKVFGGAGRKFSDGLEATTEAILDELPEDLLAPAQATPRDLSQAYVLNLLAAYRGPGLGGLRLVVDCANGATSALARRVFEGLGAHVTAIHDAPDGRNINSECGATHPEIVAAAVIAHGAEIGVAFDGDGDRCMLADSHGRVVNGDGILFVTARHLRAQGRLLGGAVVATVMSNVGLELALGQLGLPLVRTGVGDRQVLEEMERLGCNLGGEQSGHVIFTDHEPSGDGLLTALEVLEVVRHEGRSLAELVAGLTVYPQVLLNVRVRERADIESFPEVRRALDQARSSLDGRGRLLVRYSGTEPLLRVMAEGPDSAEIQSLAEEIARQVRHQIGA